MTETAKIRNFSIIAHIDHGKSTLADRLVEFTGTVTKREMQEQLLDSMDIERERGITVKLAPVRMKYKTREGTEMILNLIDTPGHVDFSYEVSRSLAACEGALLLVDATQGVQAQTLSHLNQALLNNLTIIPVVNKVDLPAAEPEKVAEELCDTFGFRMDEVVYISGKTGLGIDRLLEVIVERIPAPRVSEVDYARALIFDSFYDSYKGVVCSVKIMDGVFRKEDFVRFFATESGLQLLEVGHYIPKLKEAESLSVGEVGYIATGLKDVGLCKVGDTIVGSEDYFLKAADWKSKVAVLPGYKEMKPMVYAGLYPLASDQFLELKDALNKLKLNDSSLIFHEESSLALGHGFRCGFLGLLHAEIVHERLTREYGVDLIVTTPSVGYLYEGEVVTNPMQVPVKAVVAEPWARVILIAPENYSSALIAFCLTRRGIMLDSHPMGSQVQLVFELPLAELVVNFYDQLKSMTSGYASMDYELIDFREVEVVRLDILVAGEPVDALSHIVIKDKSRSLGLAMVKKLSEVLPRQNFAIALQAAIGGTIIAREDIRPFRKDVTAKLYGGDITRKRKLLEKQKEGKKKMKEIGRVNIPQEAFVELLKVG